MHAEKAFYNIQQSILQKLSKLGAEVKFLNLINDIQNKKQLRSPYVMVRYGHLAPKFKIR